MVLRFLFSLLLLQLINNKMNTYNHYIYLTGSQYEFDEVQCLEQVSRNITRYKNLVISARCKALAG